MAITEYITTLNELTSIADAIRTKCGTSDKLTYVSEYIDTINSINMYDIKGYLEGTWSIFADSSMTDIPAYAFFYYGSALKNISVPKCTSIGAYAFRNCTSLTSISFPECTSIGSDAFGFCTSLTSVSFPSCTSIDSYAFNGCTSLTTASFPSCTSIAMGAFYGCISLTTISFPNCTSISMVAFNGCSKLQLASFPNCNYIGDSAFNGCFNLINLNFTGISSLISLANNNAFNSTPIAGYTTSTGGVYGSIYVPSSLYDAFTSATNWTYFSSRIVGV